MWRNLGASQNACTLVGDMVNHAAQKLSNSYMKLMIFKNIFSVNFDNYVD